MLADSTAVPGGDLLRINQGTPIHLPLKQSQHLVIAVSVDLSQTQMNVMADVPLACAIL